MSRNFFSFTQQLIPHHGISRLAHWFVDSEISWLKNFLIKAVIKRYQVDMTAPARENLADYKSFNDFFTRELKPTARIIDPNEKIIVSPVDGAVSEFGKIKQDTLIQAKGHDFSLTSLLGGCIQRAKPFINGEFMTAYLAPRDYHRVHMPFAGELKEMVYLPGQLFSVSDKAAQCIPGLFARNERVVCIFNTEFGEMAVVLVGAMIVASIVTAWAGLVAPQPDHCIRHFHYDESIKLEKGQDMGHFKMGSTVILCFPENTLHWQQTIASGHELQLGQAIASLT